MPEKALPRLLPEIAEDALNELLDRIPKLSPEELRDVLFESKQSTLGKAVLADLTDLIPILSEVSGVFRSRHAAKTFRERPRRISKQLIDLAVGFLPDPVGGILDTLLPVNTLTFLREEREKK